MNRYGRDKVTNKLLFSIRSAASPRAYGYVSTQMHSRHKRDPTYEARGRRPVGSAVPGRKRWLRVAVDDQGEPGAKHKVRPFWKAR